MSYKIWKDEPFDFAPQRKLGTQSWIAFKSAGAAPAAPDYVGAAQATAQGNLQAAETQTEADRVNQTTPFGTETFTNGGTVDQAAYQQAENSYQTALAAWNDPSNTQMQEYRANGGTAPTAPNILDYTSGDPNSWTETTALTPQAQETLNDQMNIDNAKNTTALGLTGQLQSNYSTAFQAPQLSSYLTGVNAQNQTAIDPSTYTAGIAQEGNNAPTTASYLAANNVGTVNQNAPQFNENNVNQYATAAYNAANAFLAPQYAQQEQENQNKLALSGLDPSSQASNNSMLAFYQAQNQAYNQLANQSLLTGQSAATSDYNNQLAGYNASLAAQSQADQEAIGQQQADLSAYNTNNGADNANFNNALNEAQATQANIASSNSAANTAYQNALSQYQTQYGADYAARELPLNEINALTNGTQISMPSFNTYGQQTDAGGADLTSAATAQGNAAQAAYNAQSAADSSANATAGGIAGAGLSALAIAGYF